MAIIILIFLAFLAVFQSFYFYPQMPDVMASHFDGAGNPNGWMTKEIFVLFYLGMITLLIVIFLLIPKFPKQMRNLPNRDYWLSEERKTETVNYINASALRMGIATLVLLLYVMQFAFEANIAKEPRLSGYVGWALILYFIFLGVWLIKFFRRFRKNPD